MNIGYVHCGAPAETVKKDHTGTYKKQSMQTQTNDTGRKCEIPLHIETGFHWLFYYESKLLMCRRCCESLHVILNLPTIFL